MVSHTKGSKRIWFSVFWPGKAHNPAKQLQQQPTPPPPLHAQLLPPPPLQLQHPARPRQLRQLVQQQLHLPLWTAASVHRQRTLQLARAALPSKAQLCLLLQHRRLQQEAVQQQDQLLTLRGRNVQGLLPVLLLLHCRQKIYRQMSHLLVLMSAPAAQQHQLHRALGWAGMRPAARHQQRRTRWGFFWGSCRSSQAMQRWWLRHAMQ
jgi:hypothetical protein